MDSEFWDRFGRIMRAGGLFVAAALVLWRGFWFRETGGASVLITMMCFALGLVLMLSGITLLGEREETDAV